MERQLKERLVGAAVLMAMAVILIPEMLSGPRRAPPASVTPAAERNEGNLKRYTIDFNGALDSTQPAAVPETSNVEAVPPPAEEEQPAEVPTAEIPTAELPAEQSAAAVPALPAPVNDTPQEETTVVAPVEAPAPSPVVKTDPAPPPAPTEARPQAAAPTLEAPAPAAAGSTRRWAVQLIAYDNRERAQRMAEDLRESNYAAFVMPVQSPTGTLYRVRVGPFATRAEADNALRKLKTVTSDPTVVAQP